MQLDLVDVFGAGPMRGNPVAVVHSGDALTDTEMLNLTRWLNFSETTFLLPPTEPDADYWLRIFYPAGELPFAGHPTLGSCRAWLAAGGQPKHAGRIVQQCGVGLVDIIPDEDRLAFAAPPFTRYGPMTDEEIATACDFAGVEQGAVLEGVHVANGPRWQLLRLASADAVLAATPASRAPVGTDIGLAGPASEGPVDWELRAFFANQHGLLVEDPVTGSFNAGVAFHLFRNGLASKVYLAGQGQRSGADGRIHCFDDGTNVWIGGRTDMISCGGELRPRR